MRAMNRAASLSGVTRYRTRHGWISENMRGSGRQPVVEVLAVGLAVSTSARTQFSFARPLEEGAALNALIPVKAESLGC